MAVSKKPRTTKGKAVLCARAAQEKMASDIVLLDISKIDSSPAEFFVVVTVDSDPQLRAVSQEIIHTAKDAGMGLPKKDAKGTTSWLILDYFDIVIHVMLESARTFYKLEKLWGDGKVYSLSPSGVARAVTKVAKSKTETKSESESE